MKAQSQDWAFFFTQLMFFYCLVKLIHMSNNQAGKGSKPRPINKEQYDGNYEKIDWSTKLVAPKEETKKKNKVSYKY
jgi:hypothetical protein